MASWAVTGFGPYKAGTPSMQAQILAPPPKDDLVAYGRNVQRDGAIFFSDAEVAVTLRLAFRVLKLVIEPGGAAALTAAVSGKLDIAGKTVAVTLSGGNVDPELFCAILGADAPR